MEIKTVNQTMVNEDNFYHINTATIQSQDKLYHGFLKNNGEYFENKRNKGIQLPEKIPVWL